MIIILCIIFFTVTAISGIFYKKIINPISIFSGPQTISLVLLVGVNWIKSEIDIKVAIVTVCGLLLYIAGVNFGKVVHVKKLTPKPTKPTSLDDSKFYHAQGVMLAIVGIVFDCFAILYLMQLNSMYGIVELFDSMTELNIAQQEGKIGGLYNYFLPLSFPLSIGIIMRLRKGGNKRSIQILLAFQLVACFIPYLFSARRSMLFSLVVFNIIYIIITSSRKREEQDITFASIGKTVSLVIVIYLVILFMSTTQQLMNKSLVGSEFEIFGISVPLVFIDAVNYIAGNFAYLNETYDCIEGRVPLLATLRLMYLYIAPLLGFQVNAVSPFENELINIGTDGVLALFNTTPIYNYMLLDGGFLGLLLLFAWGVIAQKGYALLSSSSLSVGKASLAAYMLSIMFWSFRSYDLIFLNSGLVILYSLVIYIVEKRYLYSKN